MDSVQINNGNELVPFVEECRCPAGYTGLSCEVYNILQIKFKFKSILIDKILLFLNIFITQNIYYFTQKVMFNMC